MSFAYISLSRVIYSYLDVMVSTETRNVQAADHDCGMTKRGVDNCNLTLAPNSDVRDNRAVQTRVTVRH